VRKLLAMFLILALLLPVGADAQGDELEQKYADSDFSFGYPIGWMAIPRENDVLVSLSIPDSTSDMPGVIILTFIKPSYSNENTDSWPLDSDLTFLAGFVTCEVVTGIVEENESVEYGEIEQSTINGNDLISITFEAQEMSGNVTAIENAGQRLMVVTIGATETFKEQESTFKSIIQSVEFKN
jgi:hypothetical protein